MKSPYFKIIVYSNTLSSLISYQQDNKFFRFNIIYPKMIEFMGISKEGYCHKSFSKPFSLS